MIRTSAAADATSSPTVPTPGPTSRPSGSSLSGSKSVPDRLPSELPPRQSPPWLSRGDVWGGLAAVAVMLPQAMAFGVALFTPWKLSAASGALAGLIATASLCFGSSLLGGTMGLMSAPTGPTLVLISAAMSALAAAGLQGPDLLLGLAAVMLATGLFQVMAGLSGAGRLIKFMPFPVVAGFMTGAALLMLRSQVRPVFLPLLEDPTSLWHYIPFIAAAATMAAMRWVPRYIPAIPGTIAGLIGGMVTFHLAAWLIPIPGSSVPEAWLIGAIPGPGAMHVGLSLNQLAALPWPTVLASAAALAVLASLDTLLTAVVADATSGARHNASRELVGQGLGYLLSSVLGGMGGAGTTGATVVSVRTGGRRGAGMVAGLLFVLLIAVGGPIGKLMPISVLAGIILHVALHMIDMDMWVWLRSPRMRTEGLVALVVTVVTVSYDLMVAVGAGALIATMLFLRQLISAPVILRRWTGRNLRSVVKWGPERAQLLADSADRIVAYELRGNLFFGTADKLFEEIAADLDRSAFVILQLERVEQVDLTALRILDQMAQRLRSAGGRLIFCELHTDMGIGRKARGALRRTRMTRDAPAVKTCVDLDTAVEYAEKRILRDAGFATGGRHPAVELVDVPLLRTFPPEAVEAVREHAQLRTAAKHTPLFRAGDPGDELIILLDGVVDAHLETTAHHYRRVARFAPGAFFGEGAFLEPGPRAATAMARRKSTYLALSRAGFEVLLQRYPKAAAELLMALGRAQSGYLRRNAALIEHLTRR